MTSEDEYRVEFFDELGFVRKTCRVCGRPFWTLDPEAQTCQDAPCVEYFFDRIPVKSATGVAESRERFLKFFEKRGHEIQRPRPVVARWREDLYLTIASIVVFQPHVTSGVAPPPANPLVICQPCIRLEDIDNVGLTLGRHLTLFEMGGHHAFNSEREWLYWKDETVRYAYEFFVDELGVPGKSLTFKESWWQGGGNAGPCFEVASGGLEVATLVFMQYRLDGERLEPIPLKIVDTGYGIERIAWFTSKTPTAFHAIYGGLLEKFRSLLGLEKPPRGLLEAAFRRAGLMNVEKPETLERVVATVAEEIGAERSEAARALDREAKLYSLLDHTKTLAFMLADGVVPSNQGEGYLARLVARRALRNIALLGSEASLADLVELQVELWGGQFPSLRENANYVLDATIVEEEKFKQVLRENLPRAVALLKRGPTIENLRRVYSELGIPPELVARAGVSVEIPRGFYSLIAREGMSRPMEVPEEPAWLRGLPETLRIFHEDPYAWRIKARVLAVKGAEVVLDATIVYPTGGGQLGDSAWIIDPKGRRIAIASAETVGGKIIHKLERQDHGLAPGDVVEVEIDRAKRYKLMRHHTATHLVLGALRRILGPHVWQAGAEKTPEKARLDFTHYKPLSREELARVEEIVNSLVLENRPVRSYLIDRNEAEERYGFSIYQGGAPLQARLRIVEIEGHDAQACFGTHVRSTGEIGGVKITSLAKLQEGVYRLELVAGTEVAVYARSLEEKLDGVASVIGGDRESVDKRARSLRDELSELKSLLSRYRQLAKLRLLEEILSKAERVGPFSVYVLNDELNDDKLATEVLKEAAERAKDVVVARVASSDGSTLIELSLGAKAAEIVDGLTLVKKISEVLGGRGGGKSTHAYLRIDAPISSEKVREELTRILSEPRS
ncbi:MAG: alanine--tRNA ligase [Fervidicoccaceae archaeon]